MILKIYLIVGALFTLYGLLFRWCKLVQAFQLQRHPVPVFLMVAISMPFLYPIWILTYIRQRSNLTQKSGVIKMYDDLNGKHLMHKNTEYVVSHSYYNEGSIPCVKAYSTDGKHDVTMSYSMAKNLCGKYRRDT